MIIRGSTIRRAVMRAGGAREYTSQFVALATQNSPWAEAYRWSPSTGFGAKYSNPSPLLPGDGQRVRFNKDCTAVAYAHAGSPYITVYAWSASTGFGAKYSNPSSLPADANDVAWNPNGTAVGCVGSGPSVAVYTWNDSTGFGTRYSNPPSLISQTKRGMAWSPDNAAVAMQSATVPSIEAWPWNDATGFGTKYSAPATSSSTTQVGVVFSPDSSQIIWSVSSAPYLFAYPWNSSTGFGAKLANPVTALTRAAGGIAMSSNGQALACALSGASLGTPRLVIYAWSSSGFGAKYADPATQQNSDSEGVGFSLDNRAVAVGFAISPYIYAYPFDTVTGIGTVYSNPSPLSSLGVDGIDFGGVY